MSIYQALYDICRLFIVVIIRFRANGSIVKTLFSIPLLTTSNQAKQDACASACAYIVRNLMTELEQLEDVVDQWNNKHREDQSNDKDCGVFAIFL